MYREILREEDLLEDSRRKQLLQRFYESLPLCLLLLLSPPNNVLCHILLLFLQPRPHIFIFLEKQTNKNTCFVLDAFLFLMLVVLIASLPPRHSSGSPIDPACFSVISPLSVSLCIGQLISPSHLFFLLHPSICYCLCRSYFLPFQM